MHADITFKRQNTKDIKGQWCVQFICEYSPQACRWHTLSYGLSPHEKDLSQLLQFIHFGDSQFCLHVGISCFLQLKYSAMQPCFLWHLNLSRSRFRCEIWYHLPFRDNSTNAQAHSRKRRLEHGTSVNIYNLLKHGEKDLSKWFLGGERKHKNEFFTAPSLFVLP